MSATIYRRRALRRFERETGEKLVHASVALTTIDHRHLVWDGGRWVELPQTSDDCGMELWRGYGLSSCIWLFGDTRGDGFTRGLMRGPCNTCGVGCSELHLWNCEKLDSLMGHVNPDYWPRPVHRPRWATEERLADPPAFLGMWARYGTSARGR